MKKKYVKPEIMFENMNLNTAIASCEAYIVTNCKYWDSANDAYDGIPYFWKEMNTIFIDGDDLEGSQCQSGYYCYDIPMKTIFDSKS